MATVTKLPSCCFFTSNGLVLSSWGPLLYTMHTCMSFGGCMLSERKVMVTRRSYLDFPMRSKVFLINIIYYYRVSLPEAWTINSTQQGKQWLLCAQR